MNQGLLALHKSEALRSRARLLIQPIIYPAEVGVRPVGIFYQAPIDKQANCVVGLFAGGSGNGCSQGALGHAMRFHSCLGNLELYTFPREKTVATVIVRISLRWRIDLSLRRQTGLQPRLIQGQCS